MVVELELSLNVKEILQKIAAIGLLLSCQQLFSDEEISLSVGELFDLTACLFHDELVTARGMRVREFTIKLEK